MISNFMNKLKGNYNTLIQYRFEEIAVEHTLTKKRYRDSLGIIGIESLSFLSDRMFAVMDRNGD